jgi:hypothetical protein
MPQQNPKELQEAKEEHFKKMKIHYESLFSSPTGKIVLEDICKSAFVHKSSFDTEALKMAFHEGARNLALQLMTMAAPMPTEALPPKQAKTGEK